MTEIETIFDLTVKVEALVAEARWEEAAEMEAERRKLVELFVDKYPQRVEDLRPIHDRGQAALALAKVRREGLVVEASSFLHNVRGLRAYRANDSSGNGANTR